MRNKQRKEIGEKIKESRKRRWFYEPSELEYPTYNYKFIVLNDTAKASITCFNCNHKSYIDIKWKVGKNIIACPNCKIENEITVVK